jgi:serine/threonine-protein kinase
MSELSSGAKIAGRYVLRNPLGEGGMGIVWRATDTMAGQDVALKFVKEARASARLRRRVFREAKAACAVAHPNVVRVDDILEHDESPVIVMELLEGESLAERLDRDGELPLATLAPLMQQVVSAVGAAHALGVVHRDLKPENIFLIQCEDGSFDVKILDFGIAKLAPSHFEATQSTELTKTGALVGTPCYMAPEQVYGERDIDGRADIWALGLIMYRALSGILPTQAENVGQVMKIITSRGIWPLEQANPDLPEDITRVVNQMLVRDRADRPQSLLPVREALAAHTDVDTPEFDEPVNAPPSGESEPVDSVRPDKQLMLRLHTHADPLGETARGTAHSLRRRPRFGQVRAGLALAVAVAVGVGLVFARGPSDATHLEAFAAGWNDDVQAAAESVHEAESAPAPSPGPESMSRQAHPSAAMSTAPMSSGAASRPSPAPVPRRSSPPQPAQASASAKDPPAPPPPAKPDGLGGKIADTPDDL